MLPYRRNKVDMSKLDSQEQQLFMKYGNLPKHKNPLIMTMQKERKYFDSGDYALSKAGVALPTTVGTAIPNPDNIPHASSLGNGHGAGHQSSSISPTNSTSPVNRESSLSHSEIKGDEDRLQEAPTPEAPPANSTSPTNRDSSLSHNEIRGDEDRLQEAPPADDASTQPANVQTGFDEKLEVL